MRLFQLLRNDLPAWQSAVCVQKSGSTFASKSADTAQHSAMHTLEPILQQVDAWKQDIGQRAPFSEEVLKRIHYRFRLDWNYHSHKIEGGTLTRAETRSVMVGNIDVHGKPFRDVAEMNGHDQIVREVLKMAQGALTLSEARIKAIHKAIIRPDTEEEQRQAGVWKQKPNEIISYKGEKIAFAEPHEVPDLMPRLVNRTNDALNQIIKKKPGAPHPVVLAAGFHLEYVTIHPFFDGNGRTARILTNILLIACGLPPIIIQDTHREVYHQYLGDIQAYGGSRSLFDCFIAERVLESQQLVLRALDGDLLEEPDDVDKSIQLLKQQLAAKEEIVVLRTWETLQDTLLNGILPLLEALHQKIGMLADLFSAVRVFFDAKSTFNSHLNNHWSAYGDPGFWRENLSRIFEPRQEDANFKSIHAVSLTFSLEGLKSSLEQNRFSLHIEVYFDDYALTLQGPGATSKKYPYKAAALLADQDTWVRQWVGDLTDQIRRAARIE
ncbi:MAG: Fic family protein [Bacteroidia bacterium]|nr:Fic family protein [Bacteroidia bacterium]